jgi:hypothetical protein
MTIREYIRRRVWLAIGVAFGGVVALNVVMHFVRTNLLFLAAPLLVIVPMYAVYRTVRCPKCRGRFGSALGNRIAFPLFAGTIRRCPFCGVNLDEPMQQGRATPDKLIRK